MDHYEYSQIEGEDLRRLNELGGQGWTVVCISSTTTIRYNDYNEGYLVHSYSGLLMRKMNDFPTVT